MAGSFALGRRQSTSQQLVDPWPTTRSPRHCHLLSRIHRWPTDSSTSSGSTATSCHHRHCLQARMGPCWSSERSAAGLSCYRCWHWPGHSSSISCHSEHMVTFWLLGLGMLQQQRGREAAATPAAPPRSHAHLQYGQTCCRRCGRRHSASNLTAGSRSCSRWP